MHLALGASLAWTEHDTKDNDLLPESPACLLTCEMASGSLL